MGIPQEKILETVGLMLETIIKNLNSYTDQKLTGDEILDFFTMGAAVIIDNDKKLKSTRDFRRASEFAGKRIEQWTKELRGIQEQSGQSFLSLAMKASYAPPLNS